MSSGITEEKRHEYFIQLPIDEAIEVRKELEAAVWEIAHQESVDEILEEAKFDIRVGKTAIDPNAIITVIVTYILTKTADKTYDKVWDIWTTKIWPRLKQKFGESVLIEKDEHKKKDK